jgi:predicted type IV restriction endonuclease
VPAALEGIVAQARDLVPLLQDVRAFGDLPSEEEMVAHFVVPFLRALGWPPELIAVDWRRIDVAVFRSLQRTPGNLQMVIEAKRLGAGVEGALDQAPAYMRALGVVCDVAVSDGVRYRVYDGRLNFAHVAYANLARLKRPAAALFERIQRG